MSCDGGLEAIFSFRSLSSFLTDIDNYKQTKINKDYIY
jgi:hypothetical protein